jgi:hypothetical protein
LIKTNSYIDVSEHLLGSNPDNNLLVNVEEDSEDFKAKDLLVVNTSLKPKAGDFVLTLNDENDERYIEKFDVGTSNVFGVVTATIRSL